MPLDSRFSFISVLAQDDPKVPVITASPDVLIGPIALAGVIALFFTGLELITTHYQHRARFVIKRWEFWVYVVSYAIAGALLMFLIEYLIRDGSIKLEGSFVDNPWVQAITVGVICKGLIEIKLFTVNQTPIGLSTFVHLYEPKLLKDLGHQVWEAMTAHIKPYADNNGDFGEVKNKITRNLPPDIRDNAANKAAFQIDLEGKATVQEAMELYFETVGGSTFERVFG